MRNPDFVVNVLAATAFGAAIVLAPTAARADEASGNYTDAASGFYIGGGVGQSDIEDGCSAPGAITTSCDTRGTAWKAYGGYQINKWLAAEVGYVNFADANFGGTAGGLPFSAETQTWGITGFAVGQLPIPLDVQVLNKISILGKIGTMRWDQERNSNFAPASGSDTGWSFAWGLGLQYTFNEHFGIRAEWEQFNSVGSSATGESDIQMWTLGLNYKF